MGDSLFDLLFEESAEPVSPGVHAVISDTRDGYVVMWVRSDNPGIGAVSAWLDTLPRGRRVVFVAASGRLVGMLERRGFKPCRILSPSTDLWIEAHVRRPESRPR